MIISRKVTLSERAREFLRSAQISEQDQRLQAIIWYLKHDTRLAALRRVGTTRSSQEPLFAYRTAATSWHPSLVAFLTVSNGMQDVTIHGFLLPLSSDDGQ